MGPRGLPIVSIIFGWVIHFWQATLWELVGQHTLGAARATQPLSSCGREIWGSTNSTTSQIYSNIWLPSAPCFHNRNDISQRGPSIGTSNCYQSRAIEEPMRLDTFIRAKVFCRFFCSRSSVLGSSNKETWICIAVSETWSAPIPRIS